LDGSTSKGEAFTVLRAAGDNAGLTGIGALRSRGAQTDLRTQPDKVDGGWR
jgi:hypothetical protein